MSEGRSVAPYITAAEIASFPPAVAADNNLHLPLLNAGLNRMERISAETLLARGRGRVRVEEGAAGKVLMVDSDRARDLHWNNSGGLVVWDLSTLELNETYVFVNGSRSISRLDPGRTSRFVGHGGIGQMLEFGPAESVTVRRATNGNYFVIAAYAPPAADLNQGPLPGTATAFRGNDEPEAAGIHVANPGDFTNGDSARVLITAAERYAARAEDAGKIHFNISGGTVTLDLTALPAYRTFTFANNGSSSLRLDPGSSAEVAGYAPGAQVTIPRHCAVALRRPTGSVFTIVARSFGFASNAAQEWRQEPSGSWTLRGSVAMPAAASVAVKVPWSLRGDAAANYQVRVDGMEADQDDALLPIHCKSRSPTDFVLRNPNAVTVLAHYCVTGLMET